MRTKRLYFRSWVALALVLVPTLVTAKKRVEVIDSISDYSIYVTQHDFKEFDYVDFCNENPKYAIVTKNGKQGIYDVMLHRNITEIEFREIGYSKNNEPDDSTNMTLFFAKKGIKHGIMGVSGTDNSVMSIWMDDPAEIYSLDECTTIDKKTTKRAKRLLERFIRKQQMDNAQIVILDAKTGRLKTWIALNTRAEKEDARKLLVHSCAGSLAKPFHTVMAMEKEGLSLDSICHEVSYRKGIKTYDSEEMHHAILNGYRRSAAYNKWEQLTNTQNPSTNPFIMAVGYNSLLYNGCIITPTMMADSVSIEEDVFSASNLANLREVLAVDRSESPLLAWLPTYTEWMGYAAVEDICTDGDKDHTNVIGEQIQFAGVFPADNPLYTICIVGDKYSTDASPALFQDVVDSLTKWLLKRK